MQKIPIQTHAKDTCDHFVKTSFLLTIRLYGVKLLEIQNQLEWTLKCLGIMGLNVTFCENYLI